ncbi:hypothetical protein K504DRAFT_465431 [Pleomassaria siparia CBS 279.74]|uniref:Dopa 4,5-dioxygenase n=1 Tax=Pleomassaria siparia CBS 279.74 TaxID=1314801 RepID=A0A6G1KH06_9PLEO|nr:hypothetical protein K504DRAFT_465431 [Pleomassaria siparia CBS 279.74]
MADPSLYTYPSPLEGYQGLEPLPNEKAEDGKSYVNPPSEKKSEAYNAFVSPITRDRRGGFDIHIYFQQNNVEELKFATELWERIRREFPELRIYQIWAGPRGPHIIGMFEVNLFTPEQFGAFVPWLVINRGPLSALVHPNTDEEERDHTQRATWMGQPIPLNLKLFK